LNQRDFLDEVALVLNIKTQHDLHEIEVKALLFLGGKLLLRKYANFFEMFAMVYPEFVWDPLDRNIVPRHFWMDSESQFRFSTKLQNYFDVRNKEDWYRLSNEQISEVAHRAVRKKSVVKMLRTVYPEEDWSSERFSERMKKARQRLLLVKLREIFKNEEIHENFKHHQIKRNSGSFLELDIFLPQLDLALEFHGEQHFHEISSAGFGSLAPQQIWDHEKIKLCLENSIKLIIIPYWWNNQTDSLIATIFHEYPVVLANQDINFPTLEV